MASINGVSLKKVHYGRDHEGAEMAQADVYIDGKKAGFWSQSYMNACCDDFTGEPGYDLEDEIGKRAKQFQDGYPTGVWDYKFQKDAAIFMTHLLDLHEEEKIWRKAVRQGHPSVMFAATSSAKVYLPFNTAVTQQMLKNGKLEKGRKQLEEYLNTQTAIQYYVYGKKGDFVITCDGNNPVPEYMVTPNP